MEYGSSPFNSLANYPKSALIPV